MSRRLKLRLLTAIAFLFLICSNRLMAQEQTVTLEMKNTSLKEVLNSIEKQTSYRFSYRNSLIDKENGITVSQKNTPLNIVLSEILEGRDL